MTPLQILYSACVSLRVPCVRVWRVLCVRVSPQTDQRTTLVTVRIPVRYMRCRVERLTSLHQKCPNCQLLSLCPSPLPFRRRGRG